MDTIVVLQQALETCEVLLREMEAASPLPPMVLGGELRSAYEELRTGQTARLRQIYYQLCSLRDSITLESAE